MTRVDTVSVVLLATASMTVIDCAPALDVLVRTIPLPPVTIRTREPPRPATINPGLVLSDVEQQRIALLQRVRAPGAAVLHCATAHAEDFAGEGLIYFAGCGSIAVLECWTFAPDGHIDCRLPGTSWPPSNAATELAAEHIHE